MHTTSRKPSRSEIIASIDPEKIEKYSALQMQFGRLVVQEEVQELESLTFNGSPDFIADKNEDGTIRLKRVRLPMRHLLVDEQVSLVDGPAMTYGPIMGDENDDRKILLFKSENPEKDFMIGIFEDRIV